MDSDEFRVMADLTWTELSKARMGSVERIRRQVGLGVIFNSHSSPDKCYKRRIWEILAPRIWRVGVSVEVIWAMTSDLSYIEFAVLERGIDSFLLTRNNIEESWVSSGTLSIQECHSALLIVFVATGVPSERTVRVEASNLSPSGCIPNQPSCFIAPLRQGHNGFRTWLSTGTEKRRFLLAYTIT